MILINGANGSCIPVNDRGLHYGDGLFETVEICDGRPVFWLRHLQRLQNGCRRLGIPFPGIDLLTTEAQLLCHGAVRAVLKIIVTRGSGGRGYRQPDPIEATRVLSLHPFPEYPETLRQAGISARFCSTPLGLNPLLAGLKHLNRLEQVMARAEWQDAEIHEGLMLNAAGQVVEGTMSNLFIVKDGIMRTDPLQHCGIAGIVRGIILETCAEYGFPVVQEPLSKADVTHADEIFVTNSLIGIWPVRVIENYRFCVDGPVLQRTRAWFDAYRREDLDNVA